MPRPWRALKACLGSCVLFGAACAGNRAAPDAREAPSTEIAPPPPAGSTAALGAPEPVGIAPPHPRLEELRALFAAPDGDDAAAQGRPSEEQCRALTGFDKDGFEHCSLTTLGAGTAPCVSVVYDCGAHVCSVDYFVWFGQHSEPYVLDSGRATNLEVSPDHRYLIESSPTYDDEPPMDPIGGYTVRVDRRTGTQTVIANCFSTVLSPGARWYVCRDIGGNVLRFPVEGGAPELVAEAPLPGGERIKLGGAFDDYPAPVSFPSPRELEYELYLESGQVMKHRAAWHE